MSDAEGSQTASGSWQPDPTGRYKLRWQRSTGEWTDHVYSSEGELDNDPYGTPPAPPSSSSGNETPGAGVSPPTVGTRKPRRSGRRKLLIAFGIIVGLFIVLGIIGSLTETDSDTASQEPSQSTTTARTATTAPATTTTSRPASPVVLSGSGQDVTRAVNLAEGRWRVTFTVQGNTDKSFGTALDSNVILAALDSSDNSEYLVNDIASSGSWTSALTVGSGFGALAPGSIWFEVEGVVRSAMWQLTVEPL